MSRSLEIVDIIADAATAMEGTPVVVTGYRGEQTAKETGVSYIFGSAQYFKDFLDEATRMGVVVKLPALVLFTPIAESRNDPKLYSSAKIRLLIACGTQQAWSNEQRKAYSFENVLRPLYRRLLDALLADPRLDFGYERCARHEYSENYSYGKYGAYVDRSGEMVSEPIDAIDINNLEIKVKLPNCRLK